MSGLANNKRYESYKDSGIEWIGEIPDGWECKNIKYLFQINGKTLTEKESPELEIKYIDISSVNSYGEVTDIQTLNFKDAPSRARRIVKNGDTIVSTVRTYLKAVAYISNKHDNFVCSTGFAVLTPTKCVFKRFAKYAILSNKFIDEVVARSFGVSYPAINAMDLACIEILLPDFNDQVQIAHFLDQKTAKLDGLISKKQRLIELLKEKRQAMITHAVTKGLDPNAKMKDSGIEWIGEIPEGWDIKKIKHIFRIKKNIAGKEGYEVLSVTQSGIKVKDINSNDGQLSQDYSKYQMVKMDDYIMNHMDLLTGNVDCSKFNGVTSPDYRVFNLINTKVDSKEYFNYLLQICYRNKIFYKYGQGAAGFGRWRLQTEQFLNFAIVVPPENEQVHISKHLKVANSKIDYLIDKLQTQITKIQEYRQALITEAVTGKIDVREVVTV